MHRYSYFFVADHQIISFMSLVGLKASSNTFRLRLHLKKLLWGFILAILFWSRRKDLSILVMRPSSLTPPELYRISNLEHSRDGPVSSLPSLYVLHAKSITHEGTSCASEAAQFTFTKSQERDCAKNAVSIEVSMLKSQIHNIHSFAFKEWHFGSIFYKSQRE